MPNINTPKLATLRKSLLDAKPNHSLGAFSPLDHYLANGNPTAARLASVEIVNAYPELHDNLYHVDSRLYDLFVEMIEKDLKVAGLLEARKAAVLRRERNLELPKSAEDNPQANKILDSVNALLDSLAGNGFEGLLADLLDAVPHGISILELTWAPASDNPLASQNFNAAGADPHHTLIPLRASHRCPAHFRFDRNWNTFLARNIDAHAGASRDSEKSAIHPLKTLIARFQPRFNNPYGNGLQSQLRYIYSFKKIVLTAWLRASERAGEPSTAIKYPGDFNEATTTTAINILKDLNNASMAAIPDNWTIEEIFKSAVSGEFGKGLEGLMNYFDAQIGILIAGSTLVTQEGASGSRALGEVHKEVRDEKIQPDALTIAHVINTQLIAPFVRLNYGPNAPVPVFTIDVASEENLRELADTWAILKSKCGIRIPELQFYERFKIPVPGDDDRASRYDDDNLFQYHLQFGLLTINEARARLGLAPVAWGDAPTNTAPPTSNPDPRQGDTPTFPDPPPTTPIKKTSSTTGSYDTTAAKEQNTPAQKSGSGSLSKSGSASEDPNSSREPKPQEFSEDALTLITEQAACFAKQFNEAPAGSPTPDFPDALKAFADKNPIQFNDLMKHHDCPFLAKSTQKKNLTPDHSTPHSSLLCASAALRENSSPSSSSSSTAQFADTQKLSTINSQLQTTATSALAASAIGHARAHLASVIKKRKSYAPKAKTYTNLNDYLTPDRDPLFSDSFTADDFHKSAPQSFAFDYLNPAHLGDAILAAFIVNFTLESLRLAPSINQFNTAQQSPQPQDSSFSENLVNLVNPVHSSFAEGERSMFRPTVTAFLSRTVIPADDFDAILAAIDSAHAAGLLPDPFAARQQAYASAFTLVREANTVITEKIADALSNAVAGQTSLADFVADVDDLYRSLGLNPQDGHYLELVYDNAINRAAQHARDAAAHDLDDQGIPSSPKPWLWGYKWVHGGSSHPRPTHIAMNNFTAPVDHPAWQTFTPPPIAHGCSCARYNVGFTEAQALGLVSASASITDRSSWQDQRAEALREGGQFPIPTLTNKHLTSLNPDEQKNLIGRPATEAASLIPGDRFPRSQFDIPGRPLLNPSYLARLNPQQLERYRNLPLSRIIDDSTPPLNPRILPGGGILPAEDDDLVL